MLGGFGTAPDFGAQKPPDGLQHPDGDALKVAPLFKRTGGRQIEIYMQDIYKNWPYDNAGLNDYLSKIGAIVPKVKADSNHDMCRYFPFNEPEGNWYPGLTSNPTPFLNDWKTVYNRLRSLDPDLPIDGPNFTSAQTATMRKFLSFCKANNCLPEGITWHMLGPEFYMGWYKDFSNYRDLEKTLGIAPRTVIINE